MKLLEQIFSVTNKDKHKIITILGVKLKFTKENFNCRYRISQYLRKKRGGAFATRYYLSKYLYVPQLVEKELDNIPQNEIDKQTDNVWTMWLQEDVPECMEMCLTTIKNIYPNVKYITEKNMFDYIDIPDYIYKKYKAGIIKAPHFSDYIRACLLDKYGGTWIDASCILLNRVPEFITKQNFFVLQSDNKNNFSNFFIHSAINNYCIKTMRIFLEEYWKHEDITIDYFFFHQYLHLLRTSLPQYKKMYKDIIPYVNAIVRYMTDNIAYNADEDCWNYLSKNCFMYKFQRKSQAAIKNPNSWYWFLINKYRHGELLTPDSVNKY